jgi:tetratricopeptide (TPR) repeat protein
LQKKFYLLNNTNFNVNHLKKAYDFCNDEKYDKALQQFDLVLKEDPKNIIVLIDKGVTLQNLGNIQKSISLYNKALELDPKNLDALLNKGSALHTLAKYDQAIKCYDQALNQDKNCAMVLAYKGLSLGELGKIKDALKLFKKALEIDHDYDLAQISKDKAFEILKSKRKSRLFKTV